MDILASGRAERASSICLIVFLLAALFIAPVLVGARDGLRRPSIPALIQRLQPERVFDAPGPKPAAPAAR